MHLYNFHVGGCLLYQVVEKTRETTQDKVKSSCSLSLMGGGTLLSFLREGRRETSAMSVATWSHLYIYKGCCKIAMSHVVIHMDKVFGSSQRN